MHAARAHPPHFRACPIHQRLLAQTLMPMLHNPRAHCERSVFGGSCCLSILTDLLRSVKEGVNRNYVQNIQINPYNT
jgi:hypothetical protein